MRNAIIIINNKNQIVDYSIDADFTDYEMNSIFEYLPADFKQYIVRQYKKLDKKYNINTLSSFSQNNTDYIIIKFSSHVFQISIPKNYTTQDYDNMFLLMPFLRYAYRYIKKSELYKIKKSYKDMKIMQELS